MIATSPLTPVGRAAAAAGFADLSLPGEPLSAALLAIVGKPVHVQFDSGEYHCYSAESAARLTVAAELGERADGVAWLAPARVGLLVALHVCVGLAVEALSLAMPLVYPPAAPSARHRYKGWARPCHICAKLIEALPRIKSEACS